MKMGFICESLEKRHINLPSQGELKNIYDHLQDPLSKKIFRHRLLYSLFNEQENIATIIRKSIPSTEDLCAGKMCLFGAGGTCDSILKFFSISYHFNPPFIIDTYKTGSLNGIPIISFEDFVMRDDFRDYKILITVASCATKKKIATTLSSYGLKYTFAFLDCQYFDLPELNLSNEYFIDAGALDGETTAMFFSYVPKGHAYVLEPNPKTFNIIKERLTNHPNVECFPFGAYSENTTLSFDDGGETPSSGQISRNGSVAIAVRKLDDLLRGKKVTFIKMDIEGSELEALKGAEQIIRKQKPKLAICLYHRPEDIWEIPNLILSYQSDYKFYLRHYSFGDSETVFYAL